MILKQNFDRIDKKYSLEEILSRIPNQLIDRKEYKREQFDEHLVNFNSLRLITFKQKGTNCCNCGIKGSFFVKEKKLEVNEPYHINLYALDTNGNEVLMTHDHIISRANGGKNCIENLQTMCKVCNEMKGILENNS